MSALDKVLAALDKVKRDGKGWKARCPAHDDRTPSLSISEGDNGAVLIYCHAQCEAAAVVAAMGLEMSDLFPPRESSSRGNGRDQFQRPPRNTATPLPDTEPKRRLFTLTRADQIRLSPIAWSVRDYFVQNTLAGIVGPSGSGKSFIAVGLACCTATGHPWWGNEVKQGAVFYLAGEGQQGLSKRIRAWELHTGVSIEGAPLYLSSGLPFLCDPAQAAESADLIAEEVDRLFFDSGAEPVLIFIDTVARAMNGANENSTEDMGMFIRAKDVMRERFGATVISVHHTGHDTNNQDRGRGSSNYRANLDSEFNVKSTDTVVTFTGVKEKDWPKPKPMAFAKVVVPVIVPNADGEEIEESILVLHNVAAGMIESNHKEKATEMRRAGQSLRQIAAQIGVSKSTVENWLKAA